MTEKFNSTEFNRFETNVSLHTRDETKAIYYHFSRRIYFASFFLNFTTMHSMRSMYFCLFLFLFGAGVQLNVVYALSGQCGEFHPGFPEASPEDLASREAEMEFDMELEDLFDAVNDGDDERSEEVLSSLEKLMDVQEAPRKNPIISTVSCFV